MLNNKETPNCINCTKNGIFIVKNNKTIFQKYENKEFEKQSKEAFIKKDVNLFNNLQLKLYKTLVYGLNSFSEEELECLSEEAKEKIKKDHKTASITIQIMKCKVLYKSDIKLLSLIFPHLNLGTIDEDWIMPVPRNQTLDRLGITVKDVTDEFIKRKLLPKDFYDIKYKSIKLN